MEADALKLVLITSIPFSIIVILCSIYIFRRSKKGNSTLKNAFEDDLNKSGKMPNPLDVKGRIRYMFKNPETEEFYIRRPDDFSGNVGNKTGLIIILIALIIFIVGILGYTFLFYKIS